jgi:hypothetical protein
MYIIKVQNKEDGREISVLADSNKEFRRVFDYVESDNNLEIAMVEGCLMMIGLDGLKDYFGIK